MVYGESAKGVPPLNRTKLSKKAQGKQDEIQKKLYEANKWWNVWRFQLHFHKLEWVNQKYLTKRDTPYSVFSKTFYLNKNDITAHWVSHSQLKELDTIELFERKHMNEEMVSNYFS